MTHFRLTRPMDDNNRQVWLGAEDFESGRAPHIWTEGEVCLVVDKNGIEINIGGDSFYTAMDDVTEEYILGYANAIATMIESDRIDPRWIAAMLHMQEI